MNGLLAQARAWVKEKGEKIANHLLKTEEWLVRIDPSASEAARLAAMTHDMERAFPGEDSPKVDPSKGPADPEYNTAHQERSARIVRSYLESQGVSVDLAEQVGRLIQFHEYGGWPEANYVQAADSLSFLEVNVDYFIGRIGAPDSDWTEKYVGDKFTWMYERIQVEKARDQALPLYEEAMRKLHDRPSL
jgi:HD domain